MERNKVVEVLILILGIVVSITFGTGVGLIFKSILAGGIVLTVFGGVGIFSIIKLMLEYTKKIK